MNWKAFLLRREVTLVGLILVLFAIVSFRAPAFATFGNVRDILNDTSILVMMGIAQYLVILTGGIDLSVASIMAMGGMSAAMLNHSDPTMPIALVLLLALAVGAALGAVNGLLVGFAGITSIIATLGTISIYRGLVFVLSGGHWVSAHEMTPGFTLVPDFQILGLPAMIWYMVVVVVVFFVVMNLTKSGREIYALGGNKVAAAYIGVNAKKINFLVFTLSGLISGFTGFLYVARYAAAQNDTALGFELSTIAACVIGGVSIAGGFGTIGGVVLGAIFLGIINNALTVVELSPFYQMAIQGFVILFAIVANTMMAKRSQKAALARRVI